MKTKIIISLLGLLFIAGDFVGGCEEEEEPKPDYITVYVSVQGYFNTKDVTNNIIICDSVTQNKPVRIDFYKDSALKYSLERNSDNDCWIPNTEYKSFKLYREQRIEVKANSDIVLPGYTEIRGYILIDWDDIYPATDFGGEVYSTKAFDLLWLFN